VSAIKVKSVHLYKWRVRI